MPESTNIETRDQLSPLNFKFQIKRAPAVNFFIQKINIPEISLNAIKDPTPFTDIMIPGDHLQFNPLNIEFKVDELLQNYLEIYTWISSIGSPDSFEEYKSLSDHSLESGFGVESDISVLLQNAEKQTTFTITYKDAWPTKLSGMSFLTTDDKVRYIGATAAFQYTNFKISRYNY